MGQEEIRFVARWVLDRCLGAYGPHRGLTLLDVDPAEVHDGASAVRDLPSTHPGLAPYRQMVHDVHQVGDQGTLALLLAAGVVEHAHRAMGDGVPRGALLDGVRLAARQLRTWLPAHSRPIEPEAVLPDWADVLAGLRRLAEAGTIDLDVVDIQARDGALWSDGLCMEFHGRGDRPSARILMIEEGPRRRLAQEATWRVNGVGAEAAMEQRFLDRLEELGVDVLVVAKALGDLRDRVAARCLVQDDVPEPLRRRLQTATGAKPVARLDDATVDDLGIGDVQWTRRGGWVLQGPGPGATIRIGQRGATLASLEKDRAERMLRLCGTLLADPRGLQGGGHWQTDAASALRRMMDLAPGKSSFGIVCVARALDDVVRALRRQAGLDPLEAHLWDGIHDSSAAVEAATDAALALAQALLRIDARISKKESRGVDLRGGTAPAGSPKGMPGDIPPLM
ncbi:MAG: TCP-1/cpn60 chaperonin family protein [Thermoplasmatota archaeon]